jgi:hypothetical protein
MRSTDAVSRLEGQSLGDEDAVTAHKKDGLAFDPRASSCARAFASGDVP